MSANKILSTVRVGFAVLFLWLVLAGNWVNLKNESFGVFDSHGGAGFGIVAVVIFVTELISMFTKAFGARELLTLYPNSFACDTTEERSCAVSRNISLPIRFAFIA